MFIIKKLEQLNEIHELATQVEKELLADRSEIFLDIYIRSVPAGIDILCEYYETNTEKTYRCGFLLYPNGDTSTDVIYDNDCDNYPHWLVVHFEEELIHRIKDILFEEQE